MAKNEKEEIKGIPEAEKNLLRAMKKRGISSSYTNIEGNAIHVIGNYNMITFAKKLELTLVKAKCNAYMKESLERPLTQNELREYTGAFKRLCEMLDIKGVAVELPPNP